MIRSPAWSRTPTMPVSPTTAPAAYQPTYQSGKTNRRSEIPRRRMRLPVKKVWKPRAMTDPIVNTEA